MNYRISAGTVLLCCYVKMSSLICVHTNTRAGAFHFTPRLEMGSALLCCSCWFRLPLPLAGSKPAVTLTLVLQICSVQQNLSQPPPLSYTHMYSHTLYHLIICLLHPSLLLLFFSIQALCRFT